MQKQISKSEQDTIKIASEIAKNNKCNLILLKGDLGTGKTHFAKGFAHGMGISQNVSSPTYSLINEYSQNTKRLIHIDLYRIDSFQELIELGLFELLNSDAVCIIEWSDKLPALYELPHIEVAIEHDSLNNDTHRIISIKG